MNKVIKAALSALSKYDVDLKNRYELERQIERTTRPYYNKINSNIMERIIRLPETVIDGRVMPERESLIRSYSRDGKIAPLLLFFHGGGFVTGDFDSYNNVCANLAIKTGYKVISVNYRLAPEYPFPAGPEDCYAVTQEILLHCEDWYQADPGDVVLIGDSAGATLSCEVSFMARDRGGILPKRQILVYPAALGDYRAYEGMTEWKQSEQTSFRSVFENGTDYLLTVKKLNDYMALYVSSEEDYKHPYYAPLNQTDYSRLPETLIVVMEYDPLRDEGIELGRRMERAGNKVRMEMIQDGVHGMLSLPPSTPLTRQIYKHILSFLPLAEEKGWNK